MPPSIPPPLSLDTVTAVTVVPYLIPLAMRSAHSNFPPLFYFLLSSFKPIFVHSSFSSSRPRFTDARRYPAIQILWNRLSIVRSISGAANVTRVKRIDICPRSSRARPLLDALASYIYLFFYSCTTDTLRLRTHSPDKFDTLECQEKLNG